MADDSTLSGSMWDSGAPTQIAQQGMPPKETAPPNSQTGAENTDEGKHLQQEVDSQQTLVNEKIKAHEKFAQEEEESKRMRDDALRRMQETQQMPADVPPPQQMDLSKLDANGYQAVNQSTKWMSTVGVLGIALAGMIGKHHGGIGSQMFWGGFLNSYAKGQQAAAKEQRDEWWKHVEYEYKVNQERLANYREALQGAKYNQYLNHQQRMDLLKTYSDLYGDARMSSAASRQDVAGAEKILNDYRKGLHDYLKEAAKTGHAADYLTKSHVNKQWAEAAVGKWTESHNGVPPANEQEQVEALKEYPYSQWRKEQMTYRGTDEEGNPKVVPKYPQAGQNDKHLFDPNAKVYGGPGVTPQGGGYDKALDQSIGDLGNLYGQ